MRNRQVSRSYGRSKAQTEGYRNTALKKITNIIGNRIKDAKQNETNKEEEAPVKLRTEADNTDKNGEASNDPSQGMGSPVQKQNTSRGAQSSAGPQK